MNRTVKRITKIGLLAAGEPQRFQEVVNEFLP